MNFSRTTSKLILTLLTQDERKQEKLTTFFTQNNQLCEFIFIKRNEGNYVYCVLQDNLGSYS